MFPDPVTPLAAALRQQPAAVGTALEGAIRAAAARARDDIDSLMMVNGIASMFSSLGVDLREQESSGSAAADPVLCEGAQEELFSLVVTMQQGIAASANHVYSVPVAASMMQLCLQLQVIDSPQLLLLQARSTALLGRLLLQLHVKSAEQLHQQQMTVFIMTTAGLRLLHWMAVRTCAAFVAHLDKRLAGVQLPGKSDAAATARQELLLQGLRLQVVLLPQLRSVGAARSQQQQPQEQQLEQEFLQEQLGGMTISELEDNNNNHHSL
jgi:hypothetical protein